MSEFVRRVLSEGDEEERPDDLPPWLLRRIAEVFEQRGMTTRQHIGIARQVAEAVHGTMGAPPTVDREVRAKPSREIQITMPGRQRFLASSALRVRMIEGWIKGLRQKFFDTDAPPLKSREEAEEWVRTRGGGRDRTPWSAIDYEAELEELIARFRELTGVDLARTELLDAKVELPGGETLKVSAQTLYYPMMVELVRMSEGSGFPLWDLICYMLAGIEPELPGVLPIIEEPAATSYLVPGQEVSAQRVVVRFDGPVTHGELTKLHGPLKQAWAQSTDGDAKWHLLKKLVEEVADGGEVKHSRPFFEDQVLPRWIAAGMEKVHWTRLKQFHFDRSTAERGR